MDLKSRKMNEPSRAERDEVEAEMEKKEEERMREQS